MLHSWLQQRGSLHSGTANAAPHPDNRLMLVDDVELECLTPHGIGSTSCSSGQVVFACCLRLRTPVYYQRLYCMHVFINCNRTASLTAVSFGLQGGSSTLYHRVWVLFPEEIVVLEPLQFRSCAWT